MKNLSIFLLLSLISNISLSQELDDSKQAFKFETETINYGKIISGSDGVRVFEFTNIGKSPLIISRVQASCGCTVPVWPKEPIKPGDSAEVLANFNTAGKPNRQAKTLTLFTNTARGREILKLKGSVTPKSSSTPKK